MVDPSGRNPMARFANSVMSVIDAPITWFKGNVNILF